MPVITPAAERIKAGQSLYKAGNLVEASHHFKSVVQNCSHCQAGRPNKLCSCHDLLAAFRSHTLNDVLRVPCKCSQRAHKRCKDGSHIAALASLVMVAIKAKDHKLALVYAQNIVYLSPRDPRGYLRLAQVLRLMNRPATALAVYQQGVVLVAKADSNHPGLQALKEQAAILDKLVSQVDPFQVLPAELLVLVLRQLTTRQHCRCLAVSKTWKGFMESPAAKPLWSEQHFDLGPERGGNKRIRLNSIQRYLVTYPSGHLKSLRVDNCARFITGDKLFTVLRACPQLEDLALSGHLVVSGEMPPVHKLPKLRSLYLGPHINVRPHHLDGMITAASDTLGELNILGFPSPAYSQQGSLPLRWPPLPALHTIRISGPTNIAAIPIDMGYIMRMTPNVHTVWMEHLRFHESSPAVGGGQPAAQEPSEEQPPELPWPGLRRVYLGPCVWSSAQTPFPPLPESLTELVVKEDRTLYQLMLDSSPMGVPTMFLYPPTFGSDLPVVIPSLPKLETLVLSGKQPLTPVAFQVLAQTAFENDTLRHLHLQPFPWAEARGPGAGFLQWARPGKDQTGLASLGVHGLIGEVGRHVADPDAALLDLARVFHHLRDLDVGGETVAPETLCRVLGDREGEGEGASSLRTLYHTQGARMLELKEWAAARGKNVVQGAHPATVPDSGFARPGQ